MLPYLLAALATATITLTITRASLFQAPRVWVKRKIPFIGSLLSCTYCFSHWVAGVATAAFFQWDNWFTWIWRAFVITALAGPAMWLLFESHSRISPAAEDT